MTRSTPPTSVTSRSRASMSQTEESFDAVEDYRGFALMAHGAGSFVEIVSRFEELHSARGESLAHFLGDFGARFHDLLEAGFVEAITLDVGDCIDVGGARLAGHHSHLAEEAGRVDLGNVDAL